ncbi:DedA family protein [Pseudorhodoplanes sp.]|uniref:DedA family protein n=1 Tax=Pseudorhodoplanes sp. TaxID=1934341 RepID=UPI002CF7D339|nr:DedA family protein [Pseudorhodoplanes sp.]HWV52022.1 DedA family protein [Pseudorhodoplanes sp.]
MTDLSQLIDAVRQHGEVVYAFIFAYAASHAMLMALFAGYAAQLGVLDLKMTIIHCFAGSFIGDVVRFWLARQYGERLLARWPRISAHTAMVKRLVDRHALWLPLIHRFPYGIRGLGAFAFGLSKMPWSFFLIANLVGAAIWAVSMVLAGYAFGKVSDKVLGETVSTLSLASLLVFLAISWMLSRKLEAAIEADARRNA